MRVLRVRAQIKVGRATRPLTMERRVIINPREMLITPKGVTMTMVEVMPVMVGVMTPMEAVKTSMMAELQLLASGQRQMAPRTSRQNLVSILNPMLKTLNTLKTTLFIVGTHSSGTWIKPAHSYAHPALGGAMPAKVDPFWEECLKSVKASQPSWGAGRICRELERQAESGNRTDAPSERWVGEFLRRKLPQDLTEYRLLYWPESMERRDLPWEASAAALELLVSRRGSGRPSIRLAKWLWRVTLAAPGCSLEERYNCAAWLSAREVLGDRPIEGLRGIEWYLGFAPWRSKKHFTRYEKAREAAEQGLHERWSEFEDVPPLPPTEIPIPRYHPEPRLTSLAGAVRGATGGTA